MSEHSKSINEEIKCTIIAILCWLSAAPLLTALAALVLSAGGISYAELGYGSSVLSLILAFISGMAAAKIRKEKRLIMGMICGATLSLALISIGYAEAGKDISASGIVSVVSFTMAGAVCGAILVPQNKNSLKKKKYKKS